MTFEGESGPVQCIAASAADDVLRSAREQRPHALLFVDGRALRGRVEPSSCNGLVLRASGHRVVSPGLGRVRFRLFGVGFSVLGRIDAVDAEHVELAPPLATAVDEEPSGEDPSPPFARLHPRREVQEAEVHRLFADSGYLALRPASVEPDAWFRVDADRITRDVLYVGDDARAVGHVSITRAYSRTWLGHQLATIRHLESWEARRALYLFFATVPIVEDGADAMLLGYYDPTKRWHQLFFSSSVQWIGEEHARVVPLDRFERDDPSPPPRVELPSGFELGRAGPDDLEPAAALARESLPDLLVRAMDLDAARLRSTALHPTYAGTSHERGRDVIVLRERGELVAAALCETGSRELSLFNILNMAFVFVDGHRAPPTEAQLALLGAVRAYYRDRDVVDPIVVAPPGTLHAEREPGTVLDEVMSCIVWSAVGLARYADFLRFHFARMQSEPQRRVSR